MLTTVQSHPLPGAESLTSGRSNYSLTLTIHFWSMGAISRYVNYSAIAPIDEKRIVNVGSSYYALTLTIRLLAMGAIAL